MRPFLLNVLKQAAIFTDEVQDFSYGNSLLTGTATPLSTPRGDATPRSEHTACSPESRHSPRHFDNSTQRLGTKGDLSMEQSCYVTSPCQVPDAYDDLSCEEIPFLGGLFEGENQPDNGMPKTGGSVDFVSDRKLNGEIWPNSDSRGNFFLLF